MNCSNAETLKFDYEIKLSYDASYYNLDSIQSGKLTDNTVQNNIRSLIIEGKNASISKVQDTLNLLYGYTLMGRSETIPLKIDYVKFKNDRYIYKSTDGTLTLNSCAINLSGIKGYTPTTLQISPNPANNDINLSVNTSENGHFEILIYNISCKIVSSFDFNKSNNFNETLDFKLNTSEISSGIYSLQLKSGTGVIVKSVMVEK